MRVENTSVTDSRRRRRRLRLPIAGLVLAVVAVVVWVAVKLIVPAPPSPFTLVATDNFTGSSVDTNHWTVYSGAGANAQNWNPANCVVAGGVLSLRTTSDGTTCGIASRTDQTFGAYEVRAKFDAPAAPQFDTTFIAWPQNDDIWQNAEIDYVEENDPARQSVTGFVHCTACPGGQLEAGPEPLSMSEWHTYRMEWTPTDLRFLIDGTVWFETTDKAAISTEPHHATLQTNYEADGKTPIQTTTEVDWMKIYRYAPKIAAP